MRILIDIAHPAHIHYFRNFAKIMKVRNHTCLFTLRDKGIIVELAKYYELDYSIRSIEYKSKLKYFGISILNIYKIAKEYNPDIFLDMGTIVAAPVAKIFNKPYIAFDDTEVSVKARQLHMPFTDVIITPDEFYKNLGKKHIRFSCLMELMYLHKRYFSKNKESLLPYYNDISNFVLIRFVSWEAHHDKGKKGLDLIKKIQLVEFLSKKYEVIISSEGSLPVEIKKFQIKSPPYLMHQVLAHSKMVITEGATMATEAVILGIPTIYINSIQSGNSIEQQKRGLLFSLINDEKLYETIKYVELTINNDKTNEKFVQDSSDYFKQKIDGTEFLIWFIENYPQSFHTLKENPDFQLTFK